MPKEKVVFSHLSLTFFLFTGHFFLLYFTLFSRGFARLAAGLAFLVELAKIAPADFIDIPCLRAMLF